MKTKQLPENQIGTRLDQLQFLRFIAFLAIFKGHAKCWVFWNSDISLSSASASAVSFFIILSGVLSGYSSYNKSTQFSFPAYRKYMLRKIKQVYPLHLLTAAISLFRYNIPYSLATHEFAAIEVSLKEFFLNIFLIQSWWPPRYFWFNGVSWFLSTILFLYLLNMPVSVVLNKIKKSNKGNTKLVAGFCIIIGITVFYNYITRNLNMEFWQYVFPPSRMGEYVGGMIFGFLICSSKNRIPHNKKTVAFFSILEILALLYWGVATKRSIDMWQYRVVEWIVPNFFLLGIFTLGIGKVSSLFRCENLVYLGDISFECFMIHQVVIKLYILSTGVEEISILGSIFSFSLCLFITIMSAHLIHPKSSRREKTN